MRYFLMVLSIGAAVGALVAASVAVAVWPEQRVVYQVEVVERLVTPTFQDAMMVETPVIDALITDDEWAELHRQSDCLFDWLQKQVGYEITLDRVVAAGYWTDALGGACYVMGED